MKVVEGNFGKDENTKEKSLYKLIAMALAQGGVDEDSTGEFLLIARPTDSDLNIAGSNMEVEDLVYTLEAIKYHIINYGGLNEEESIH